MIGVFGGTFAPIHNGHLRVAIEAREQLGLTEIRFIPARQPPLRPEPSVPGARRMHWVRLAIQDEPGLRVDDRELRRDGPSYTLDTLAGLREEFPRTPLLLLLGMDAVGLLPQWHRWGELTDYAHLVFFNRPGDTRGFSSEVQNRLQGRQAHHAGELAGRPAGLWWRCIIPPLDISASRIRDLLAAGRSVRGLVPDAVVRDFTADDIRLLARKEGVAA